MNSFRPPKQRLPDHLRRLRRPAAGDDAPAGQGAKSRGGVRSEDREAAPSPAPDRLTELLPGILRAMVGERLGGAPVVIDQADIFAALAPYHRPKSRFDSLMMRKLVGEGYLKPRGARDKHGLSAAYLLTPKGEALLGWRRTR